MLVELVKKRKLEDDTFKVIAFVIEFVIKRMRVENRIEEIKKLYRFKEVDREFLIIDESSVVGFGIFGYCFFVVYRSNFSVFVKVMKIKDFSLKEMERVRKEIIYEVEVIVNFGDYFGIFYLFGVCIDKVFFYLVF